MRFLTDFSLMTFSFGRSHEELSVGHWSIFLRECQLLLQPHLVQTEEIQLLQGLFTVVTRAKYRASSSSSMSSADCIQKCQTREATCTWSLCCARGFICIKIYDVFITCAKEKKKKSLVYFSFTMFVILALENSAKSLCLEFFLRWRNLCVLCCMSVYGSCYGRLFCEGGLSESESCGASKGPPSSSCG